MYGYLRIFENEWYIIPETNIEDFDIRLNTYLEAKTVEEEYRWIKYSSTYEVDPTMVKCYDKQ